MKRTRRVGRGSLVMSDDPADLPAPRLPSGADVGWAVSELFEAAWVAAGRDVAELTSPRAWAAQMTPPRGKRGAGAR